MRLSAEQTDRAVGALLGAAAGDALGVPYEFRSRALVGDPQMLGGGPGGIAPGRWSDDTGMACAIALVAATGADVRDEAALDDIAGQFLRWYDDGPPDIGIPTRQVLGATTQGPGAASRMRQAATVLHRRTGRSAGFGSLMRTSPVALAHLGDPDAIAAAARAIGALTHHDAVAGDACALWCLAIDLAVRTGMSDLRAGLGHVDARYWEPLIDLAGSSPCSVFAGTNGWVVAALQHAWAAVHVTGTLPEALHTAVAGGGDTDTVAAIAGGLAGAVYDGSAVPVRWSRLLHG